MIKEINGYKVDYLYKGNCLLIRTPNDNLFTMNLTGLLDEKGIKNSVKQAKWYKSLYISEHLNAGANADLTVRKAQEIEDDFKKMKEVLA